MTQVMRYRNLESFGFGPNVMKKIKVCRCCGSIIKTSSKMCPECGKQLSKDTIFEQYKRQHISCSACDTVLAPDSLYCPNCGKRILKKASGSGNGGE